MAANFCNRFSSDELGFSVLQLTATHCQNKQCENADRALLTTPQRTEQGFLMDVKPGVSKENLLVQITSMNLHEELWHDTPLECTLPGMHLVFSDDYVKIYKHSNINFKRQHFGGEQSLDDVFNEVHLQKLRGDDKLSTKALQKLSDFAAMPLGKDDVTVVMNFKKLESEQQQGKCPSLAQRIVDSVAKGVTAFFTTEMAQPYHPTQKESLDQARLVNVQNVMANCMKASQTEIENIVSKVSLPGGMPGGAGCSYSTALLKVAKCAAQFVWYSEQTVPILHVFSPTSLSNTGEILEHYHPHLHSCPAWILVSAAETAMTEAGVLNQLRLGATCLIDGDSDDTSFDER
jgi:hypothetical protein